MGPGPPCAKTIKVPFQSRGTAARRYAPVSSLVVWQAAMAAIASGQATVSGGCANAGSDAAARVMNVKLKHCESRMTSSYCRISHGVHQCCVLVVHHCLFASKIMRVNVVRQRH